MARTPPFRLAYITDAEGNLEWFERCVKICPVLHYSGDPPLGTVAAATDSELVLEGANPSTTSRRRPAPTHSLRTRVA